MTAALHENVYSSPPGRRTLMASVLMRIYLFFAFGRLVPGINKGSRCRNEWRRSKYGQLEVVLLVGANFGGSHMTRSYDFPSRASCCIYSMASALTISTPIGTKNVEK